MIRSSYSIAVLLTCHNRKQLTRRCLTSLISSASKYLDRHIYLHFFITDDNCTDGTSEMIEEVLSGINYTIIKADGNAFWAGGMRIAWKKALSEGTWDYYLLLNDDVELWDNLFNDLFEADRYALDKYNKVGIYSGNTADTKDYSKITFGGKIKKGKLITFFERIYPNGTPQRCDIVNANILLVHKDVVSKIGIFPDCYIHGCADNDYGLRANKFGFPVLITSHFCGVCAADNYIIKDELKKLKEMSLRKRFNYLHFPVHSIRDLLCFSLRWRISFIPVIIIRQIILFCCPSILDYIYSIKKK